MVAMTFLQCITPRPTWLRKIERKMRSERCFPEFQAVRYSVLLIFRQKLIASLHRARGIWLHDGKP